MPAVIAPAAALAGSYSATSSSPRRSSRSSSPGTGSEPCPRLGRRRHEGFKIIARIDGLRYSVPESGTGPGHLQHIGPAMTIPVHGTIGLVHDRRPKPVRISLVTIGR